MTSYTAVVDCNLSISMRLFTARTMAHLCCSFRAYCDSKCDLSSGLLGQNQLVPPSVCKNNIKTHLKGIKVTQTWAFSEKELILARVGLFDMDGDQFTICPKHRAELGVKFRPRKKCQHPLHGHRKSKPDRSVNLKMSKEIKAKWNTVVPIGAGKSSFDIRTSGVESETKSKAPVR